MRCSLSLLTSVSSWRPLRGLAQSRYNVGTPLSQKKSSALNSCLARGKELPPGHGSSKEGRGGLCNRCAVCHGQNGKGV